MINERLARRSGVARASSSRPIGQASFTPRHPGRAPSRGLRPPAGGAATTRRATIAAAPRYPGRPRPGLGAAHPSTQDCRRDLADAYEFAGVPDASIALRGAALADRELALGADHPDTLASREDLARAYRSGDRVAEAITLYEDILADRERILGPGHPDTRVARHNLAVAYEEAGRAAEAIELLDAVIADDEAALGRTIPRS